MKLSVFSDEYYMQLAIKEAQKAFELGEIPVGAVIVGQQQILAKAHNRTEILTDVTAHAEILAISTAAQLLGSKYLKYCRLYVTLEPCVMCAGALAWAQLGKIVFGASDPKRGFQTLAPNCLHPKTEVYSGLLETECQQLLKNFFRTKR